MEVIFRLTRGATLLISILMSSLTFAEKQNMNWTPWVDPANPAVMLMEKQSINTWAMRRSAPPSPKREPGVINLQRYQFGIGYQGFPTFFGLPVALTPEDLKASKVEVAIIGMVTDDNIIKGAGYAANKLRTLTDYMRFPAGGMDQYVRVNPFNVLNIADYGNVTSDFMSGQRTSEEIRKTIGEVLSVNVIPVAVGGTHVQLYGMLMALADKYGAGNIAVLHFDAHCDSYTPYGGIFVHNGSMLRVAVDNKIIKGSDIIQIGLRSVAPNDADMKWMRENKLKYHFMAEIEKYGFKNVMDKVMADLKALGKKVYVSVDIDVLDPAYAPAVGTQEPDGLTSSQMMQMLRAVAIQNDIAGIEFIEYNPFMDDRHETTGILINRMMRSFLAGLALKKQGITDPYYLAPEALHYQS